MKTANERILEFRKNVRPRFLTENIAELMKGYAEDAMKADRINLLNYVEIVEVGGIDSDGENYEVYEVDKDSIINAPYIGLL